MSTITSSSSKFIGLSRSRSPVLVIHQGVSPNSVSSSTRKSQQSFTAIPSLFSRSVGQRSLAFSRRSTKMNKIVCYSSGIPTPPGPPSHSWKGWVIGMIISVVIPFWRHKWGPLQIIKNRVDMVMNTVEVVAEVVETVAHKVEEVADGISHKLPEDGKLKSAVEFVEAVAHEAAKDAHTVDKLIENVEAVEDKVEHFFDGAGDKAAKDDGGSNERNVEEEEEKDQ